MYSVDAGPLSPVVDAFCYLSVGTLLAVFAAVLCYKIAPAAGGSGIPEMKTILGGFSLPRVLDPWTLLIKVIALAMAVASGLGLGKEGPMVHVGSCWAETFSLLSYKITGSFTDATRKNALLSAGSAAGNSVYGSVCLGVWCLKLHSWCVWALMCVGLGVCSV